MKFLIIFSIVIGIISSIKIYRNKKTNKNKENEVNVKEPIVKQVIIIDDDELLKKDPRADIPDMYYFEKNRRDIQYYLIKHFDLFTYEEKKQLVYWHFHGGTSGFDSLTHRAAEKYSKNEEFRELLLEAALNYTNPRDFLRFWEPNTNEIDQLIDKLDVNSSLEVRWFFETGLESKCLSNEQQITLSNKIKDYANIKNRDISLSVADYAYNVLKYGPCKESQRILIEAIINDCDSEPYKKYSGLGSKVKDGFDYGAELIKNKFQMDEDLYQKLMDKLLTNNNIVFSFLSENLLDKNERSYLFNKLINVENPYSNISTLLDLDEMYSSELKLVLNKICDMKNIDLATIAEKKFRCSMNKFPEEKEIIDSLIVINKLVS